MRTKKKSRRKIWKGIGFIVLGFVCLFYGVFGMEAGQVYYGEESFKGLFFMAISMAITFFGFFYFTFTGFFKIKEDYA